MERDWVGEEGEEGFQEGFKLVFAWAVVGLGGGLEEKRGIVISFGRERGRRREGVAMGEPGMISEASYNAHSFPLFPLPAAASFPPEPLPLPTQRLHFHLVVHRRRHGCQSPEGEGVVYPGGMGEVCRVAMGICHCVGVCGRTCVSGRNSLGDGGEREGAYGGRGCRVEAGGSSPSRGGRPCPVLFAQGPWGACPGTWWRGEWRGGVQR